MSNYKKVLLIGVTSSDNLGDSLISLLTYRIMKDKGMDVEIANIETMPFFYKLLRKFRVPLNYQKIADMELTQKLRKSNSIIVFAGGQMFFNYFVPYLTRIKECADKTNTPIIFNSCGFGPLSKDATSELAQILNGKIVKQITVRDSLEKAISLTKKAFFIPDVAICTNIYYTNSGDVNQKIGLGVIDTDAYNINHPDEKITKIQYLEIMFGVVTELSKTNRKIELFTTGIERDQKMAIGLQEYCMAKGVKIYVAKRPKNVEQLLKTITSYQSIVSSRLHSLIIAYSYGIPSIGLSWDSKVDYFFEIIGYKNRFIPIKKATAKSLSNAIQDLDNGVDSKHKCLLQNQVLNNIETIKELVR